MAQCLLRLGRECCEYRPAILAILTASQVCEVGLVPPVTFTSHGVRVARGAWVLTAAVLPAFSCHHPLEGLCALASVSISELLTVLMKVRPFHPRVTAVARKRPRLFCQKCRWRLHLNTLNTLDPTKSEWADYTAVQA